jgi:exopolysaccharide biosynthesis operon protein EpsL
MWNWRSAPRALVWTACALSGALPACAPAADVVTWVAGAAVINDSNVFRLPASADIRDDTVHVVYGGVRIDKPYGLQKFQFDLTATAFRHVRLPQLDFNGIDYRAEWLWKATPRVSGHVGTDRKQSLVSFADSQVLQRNVRNTDTRSFGFDWAMRGGLHVVSDWSHKQQKTETAVATQPDFELVSTSPGLKYEASSGNTLSGTMHLRDGRYLNTVSERVDSGFQETESELQATWRPSARSTVHLQAGLLDRRHENLHQRDFAGPVGIAAFDWTPAGKLQLNAAAKRKLAPSLDPFSTHSVHKVLSVAPIWQASDKLAMRLEFEATSVDFRSPPGPPPPVGRHDLVRSRKLSADWLAARVLSLSVSAQRVTRVSTDPAFGFEATIVQASMALSY